MDHERHDTNLPGEPEKAGDSTGGAEGNREEQVKGGSRKLILVGISIFLVAIVAWQGISSVMFNREVATLQAESNDLQEQLDKLAGIRSLTLVQVVDQVKELEENNEDLQEEYRNLTHQYRFTLPFLRTSSLPEALEARSKKLGSLAEDGDQLLSLVQRSEQIDKDVAAIASSSSMTWGTIFSKMESILAESSELKSDINQLVVPGQLEFYRDTFTEALSEKDLYLTALNDYLRSDFNAYTNANMAISTYNNANFYWELDQAVAYASEAEEYRNQAEYQLAEAASHWERYMELKKKIKVDGESI